MVWLKPDDPVPSFGIAYSVAVAETPIPSDKLPENCGGADQIFIIARIFDEVGEDHFNFTGLDGSSKSNADLESTCTAWLAFTVMLRDHLAADHPLKEMLVGIETRYQRLLRGEEH